MLTNGPPIVIVSFVDTDGRVQLILGRGDHKCERVDLTERHAIELCRRLNDIITRRFLSRAD